MHQHKTSITEGWSNRGGYPQELDGRLCPDLLSTAAIELKSSAIPGFRFGELVCWVFFKKTVRIEPLEMWDEDFCGSSCG